jgi:hypothetical protein
MKLNWTDIKQVTAILVDVSVLVAAFAALIKFRVYNMFSYRYRGELACKHYVLPAGDVVFVADYTIHNTGSVPITFSSVTLHLCAATRDTRDRNLLVADEEKTLAKRVLTDRPRPGLLHIEPGERSIFQLRCQLPKLDHFVFLVCQPSWSDARPTTPYRSIYVRVDDPAKPTRLV